MHRSSWAQSSSKLMLKKKPGLGWVILQKEKCSNCFARFQFSFLIAPEVVPGRLALIVTLLLCLVNTLNSVNRHSPRADSGATALLKWVIFCKCFLLVPILEYGWILAVTRESNWSAKPCQWVSHGRRKKGGRNVSITDKLDKMLCLAFPITFIISSVLFWEIV